MSQPFIVRTIFFTSDEFAVFIQPLSQQSAAFVIFLVGKDFVFHVIRDGMSQPFIVRTIFFTPDGFAVFIQAFCQQSAVFVVFLIGKNPPRIVARHGVFISFVVNITVFVCITFPRRLFRGGFLPVFPERRDPRIDSGRGLVVIESDFVKIFLMPLRHFGFGQRHTGDFALRHVIDGGGHGRAARLRFQTYRPVFVQNAAVLIFVIIVKSLFRDAHFPVGHFINGFLRDFAAFAIGIGNGAFDFSVIVEFDNALLPAVLVVFALGRHTPVFVIAGFVFLPVFIIRVFARTIRHFTTVEFLLGNETPLFVIGIFCFARKMIGVVIFPTGGNIPFFVAANIGGTENVLFDLDFFLTLSGLLTSERIC